MPLGDEQIERYSRQIIVPGIGGRGQERLLAASVLIAGVDEVARTVALYAAGAGVGRIGIATPSDAWGEATAAELADLNSDTRVERIAVRGPAGEATWAEAPDAVFASARPLDLLRRAARAARGGLLVSAGTAPGSGWLTIGPADGQPCAVCAALEHASQTPNDAVDPDPSVAAVVGSLAALALLRSLLGLDQGRGRACLRFDAEFLALEVRDPRPRPGCELCGAIEREA